MLWCKPFHFSCILHLVYNIHVYCIPIEYLLPCIFFYLATFILFLYPVICILCDRVLSVCCFVYPVSINNGINIILPVSWVCSLYLVNFTLVDLNCVSCICITSTCINSCIHSLYSLLCQVHSSCILCCVQCILENAWYIYHINCIMYLKQGTLREMHP